MEIKDWAIETTKSITLGSKTKLMYNFTYIIVELQVPTVHNGSLAKRDVFLTGSVR